MAVSNYFMIYFNLFEKLKKTVLKMFARKSAILYVKNEQIQVFHESFSILNRSLNFLSFAWEISQGELSEFL